MNKREKVVLLEDIGGVGRKNEIKEISWGFAHNFLFPSKKAIKLEKEGFRYLKREKERELKTKLQKEKVLLEVFKLTKDFEVEIKKLREEKGRVFGSLTLSGIIKLLNELFRSREINFQVNKNNFQRDFKPLTKKGQYTVKLKISKEFTSNLKINLQLK